MSWSSGAGQCGVSQGAQGTAAEALADGVAELLAAVLAVPTLNISAEAQAALLYAATENGGVENHYDALGKAIVASIATERERKAFAPLCARAS